jgi:hypothetical protein
VKVAGYLIFVGVIAGLILGLKLPSAILAGYLLIAAIGSSSKRAPLGLSPRRRRSPTRRKRRAALRGLQIAWLT